MTDQLTGSNKDKVFFITKDDFVKPIECDYARAIGDINPEELYDKFNPGPTLPDGSINFECHCVSHLVASPCGYDFREAIKCQKSASEEELNDGKCADEFIKFMECVIRTDCFKSRGDEGANNFDKKKQMISEELREKNEEAAIAVDVPKSS